MPPFVVRLLRQPWLFVVCVLVFVGFVGPELISAPSTLAVLAGLGLLALLVAWGRVLLRRYPFFKE